MSEFCIETTALTKQFGRKLALDDFSIQISEGGIHAIVGSNGAGKSTLFRLLLGMETPSRGSALVLGEDSQQMSAETRGLVGYVNEEHTLPPWMKAGQVVKMQKHFYPDWQQQRYEDVVGYFDVDPDQKVSGLSRGERAGLNLAIAMAQNPRILILDEPTLGLDVVSKQSFLEALMFADETQQMTVIYCSHQMEEIERVADELIVMEKGKLTHHSSPEAFVERISSFLVDINGHQLDTELIPGFLVSKKIDDQHQITLIDHQGDLAEMIGANDVQPVPVNLELAINSFLSKNHRRPAARS